MLTKTLKKMEVTRGFIQIPVQQKAELLGKLAPPFNTKLNSEPAHVDKYGRIWSAYLKNKYPIDTRITIDNSSIGFQIVSPEHYCFLEKSQSVFWNNETMERHDEIDSLVTPMLEELKSVEKQCTPKIETSELLSLEPELKVPTKPETLHSRNKLNDLTGKEWIQETNTIWFQKGLGKNHAHAKIEQQHPAPFSFQDIARLVRFFTKAGNLVPDPFCGVASTLKACAITGREGTGIELIPKWATSDEVACRKKSQPHFPI